jgi:hypothetical protein
VHEITDIKYPLNPTLSRREREWDVKFILGIKITIPREVSMKLITKISERPTSSLYTSTRLDGRLI